MPYFKLLKYIYSLCFIFIVLNIQAKNEIENPVELDSIANMLENIKKSNSDIYKISLNDYLFNYLKKYLQNPNSFNVKFENISNLTVLRSSDNLLNVYTWNLYYTDGSFQYFGFLQYKLDKKTIVYPLIDKKYGAEDIDIRLYASPSDWYGAIYYEVITKKWNNATYYTLIGWDGADFMINRKVVEVLSFDRRGVANFGKKIFKINRTNVGRLIFEYSDKVTMLLRYNEKKDMIVLDHLVPSETKYQNMYQYYGPDFSFDALVFRAGKWMLEQNIDPDVAINYKKNSKVNFIKRRGRSDGF